MYSNFNKNRIGLLGGTFNPIHKGHLEMARIAKYEFGLSDVVFVVSGNPPHKSSEVSANDRLAMTKIAVGSEYSISDIEIVRPGKTYTIDTLLLLKQKMKDTQFFYIIGADTAHELVNWKNYEQVLCMTDFILVNRPGYDSSGVKSLCAKLEKKYSCKFFFSNQSGPDVSSSSIRKRICQNLNVDGVLSDGIFDYINVNSLYAKSAITFDAASELVKAALTDKRFNHTQGVIESATILAKRYNLDIMAAKWAGLLHDVAKQISFEDSITLCKKYGIEIIEDFIESPKIIHGFLGESIAKYRYMIEDNDILNAIRYHSTGRPGMSMLEKVIYIADFIEPNRKLDGIEKLREVAMEDIDAAMVIGLNMTIGYLEQDNKRLSSITTDALKYYLNIRKAENN